VTLSATALFLSKAWRMKAMFNSFYGFSKTPFDRNISCDSLYTTREFEELMGLLRFVAKNRKFCAVTGDVGVGKTTAIRNFVSSLDPAAFRTVYISDSDLTPRVFYWEVLKELIDLQKPCVFRADGKRKMMDKLTALLDHGKQAAVIVIDEAHLLSREMLEETRFLLNYKMDSQNPMSLIICGQNELRAKLSKDIYEPICQRIDHRFKFSPLDRSQTEQYISRHLAYAGAGSEIFSPSALDRIFAYSNGVARKINKLCTLSLMAAYQKKKHIIDEPLVSFVIDQELTW